MSGDFSTEHPPAQRWNPGWYPDHDNGGERWWDGEEWDRSRWRPRPEDEGDRGSEGCGGSEAPPSSV